MGDYFSREAFRNWSARTDDEDDLIDDAQQEVVERLESWARSAWPTVVETPPEDGQTDEARVATESFDGGRDVLVLSRAPVLELEELTIGGDVVSADAFTLYDGVGKIVFGQILPPERLFVVVRYRYGHTSTPATVRRLTMAATKTLLEHQPGEKRKVPSNVRQHSTEGTTFVWAEPPSPPKPWPWDRESSEQMATYWSPPKQVMSFV